MLAGAGFGGGAGVLVAASRALVSSSGRARRRLIGMAAAAARCSTLWRCSGPQWLGMAMTTCPFRCATGKQPSSWQRSLEKAWAHSQRASPAASRSWRVSTASPNSSSTSRRCWAALLAAGTGLVGMRVISGRAREVRASAACGGEPLHTNMSRSDLRFGQHERRSDPFPPGIRRNPQRSW